MSGPGKKLGDVVAKKKKKKKLAQFSWLANPFS